MHYLDHFQIIRPQYELGQQEILNWLSCAHARAGKEVQEALALVGLGAQKIQKRGFEIADVLHTDFSKMHLYGKSAGIQERFALFDKSATQRFEEFYPENTKMPEHIIHVTCTGYLAPSPAQKLVSKRGASTSVTHAYHMGCYASLPAIRMALQQNPIDIVHTELCSLHMNPELHTMDQLVAQSLFADGFIKYSVSQNPSSLKILQIKEQIIPGTLEQMSWSCEPWGLKLGLAKEIPRLIGQALPEFLKSFDCDLSKACFAVHPGGPKILNLVTEKLELSPSQLQMSYQILYEYGNMSSATLPHIWSKMASDETILPGTPIISLAFGPGLTICGALFEKCG